MSTAQKEQLPRVDPKRDLDFYNIKENRQKVSERDKYLCHYCKKQLARFSATLDHIQPISKGGDNSYENLVTACLLHNSQPQCSTNNGLSNSHAGARSRVATSFKVVFKEHRVWFYGSITQVFWALATKLGISPKRRFCL